MITRRGLLTGLGAFGLGGTGLAGYAASESWFDGVTHYNLSPPGWPADRSLRIVALADIHACEPFMGLARVRRLVAKANALRPDVTVLLGDYVPSRGLLRYADWIEEPRIAEALGALQAPRGVFAILGNHDWWEDDAAMARRGGPTAIGRALAANGIRVLENGAERTGGADHPVWIAGLGDQWAFWRPNSRHELRRGRPRYIGIDDLPGTLGQVTDTAPVILLIHEPDGFVNVPDRVALTLAGHTHGGQVQLFGYAPIVPSMYGRRFVYGHIVENDRHLVVSGGLGCSGVPIRFGCPPEIVVVDLGPPRREALA
ncbi:MAG: metallophosphoesterase [Hyphomicrobiaceae bacterium]